MKKVQLANGQQYGITDQMSGKMEGMWSINTSPSTNPFCLGMRKRKGCICAHCYSSRSENRYKFAKAAWINNGDVLSTNKLKDSELYIFKNKDILRYQAHGDLINKIHYFNLIKIAEANAKVMIGFFTKNLKVIKQAGMKRLDNLIYIYSTPEVNNLNPTIPDGFDRVFSVYTKDFIAEKDVDINCGAKECNTCRTCYTQSDVVFVNEKIK